VPRYEYRCRDCAGVFEVSRPMAEAGLPAPCPAGHADTVKLLSAVALTGSLTGGSPAAGSAPVGAPAPRAGGCCGGACGCG
jgi:putative FmdB family regulatory protein